ncbi:unnamed protein product [Lathyrus sativus]|nr:unnamed protein product [Lathyrus sativus]
MMQSFKKFTPLFIVILIALPFLLMNSKSNFSLFDDFTKDKMLHLLGENKNGGRLHNISDDHINVQNNTDSKVQGKIENGTTPTEVRPATTLGLKNDSLTSSTNNREKFLDGLLPSGIDDEPSCISRHQSHLFRKSSPHKPSSYLISKLRNYEKIHKRCGPNTNAYRKSMEEILHSNNINNDYERCKYLIWTRANGLGNQMISMAATFLYALLTDRVLLVRFGKDKQGLFCEPFLNSTWLLPQNSPFWSENHVETYESLIEKEKANNNSYLDLPSALFLNLQYQQNYHEKFFHCDDRQDLLSKIPLMILLSDQYFVPSLFMTPLFNKELEKMFIEKEAVFHHLARYLFHPSNSAWRLITTFYQQHLAKADEKVGLQIRVFRPNTTPQQAVMNLVLNCTLENKLLPKVLDMNNSVSSGGIKVVLVASLYPEYGENLKTLYMNKSTVTGEVVEVYQPSGEEEQKFNDNTHNMKALVDMYLLSLSDVLVTTSLSTFGYVAQGLGNLKPWLLYRLGSNESHYPACEREFSMEPCYHYPPKNYCGGKAIHDYAASFIYMRKCKDYSSGVKMINNFR